MNVVLRHFEQSRQQAGSDTLRSSLIGIWRRISRIPGSAINFPIFVRCRKSVRHDFEQTQTLHRPAQHAF